MNFLRLQLNNAIANGRIAMRIERDERDQLKQAIEKGKRMWCPRHGGIVETSKGCPRCADPLTIWYWRQKIANWLHDAAYFFDRQRWDRIG